jgi:hypothetical protein
MQNFLKQSLEEHFSKDDILTEQIFNELVLYVYSIESKDTDLPILARIFPEEQLQKLITYYDGDTLKLPSREEYRTCLLTALCFWLKTFKGYSWFEIKDYLNIPDNNKDILSSISIGGKINKLKDALGKDLIANLDKIEEKEFVSYFNKNREQ